MMEINEQNEYWVELSSEINPDYYYLGGSSMIEEKTKKIKSRIVRISSLLEAKEVVMKFIFNHNLGSGNFTGGIIIDSNNNFVAKISYNGCCWDALDWREAKEITL